MNHKTFVLFWLLENCSVSGVGLVLDAVEQALPLPSYSVDRVLLVHSLEHSENLEELLREVWRLVR